jgi:hypothetical protein
MSGWGGVLNPRPRAQIWREDVGLQVVRERRFANSANRMCYELRRLQVGQNSFEEALVASLILSHRKFNVRELELLNGGYTSVEYAENLSSSKVHRTAVHATHARITHIVKCLTFILLSRHSLRRYKDQFQNEFDRFNTTKCPNAVFTL